MSSLSDIFNATLNFGGKAFEENEENINSYIKKLGATFSEKSRCDLLKCKNEYQLYVEVPGLMKNHVDIAFVSGVLTIKATVDAVAYVGDFTFLINERSGGPFERSFQIPNDIYPDKITANVENGILMCSIPRTQPPPPVKYSVNVE